MTALLHESWVRRTGAALHRARHPLGVAAAYVLASALFTLVAGHDGLLAPFGDFRLGTLLLGFLTLALRLVTLFFVLPWTVFRLLAPEL